MKELLDWCEKQGSADLLEVANILHENASVSGDPDVLKVLWSAAVGESEPDQTPEKVEVFYRRFPSLPILRPLMRCYLFEDSPCHGSMMMSFIGYIRHLSGDHNKNAGEIAAILLDSYGHLDQEKSQ